MNHILIKFSLSVALLLFFAPAIAQKKSSKVTLPSPEKITTVEGITEYRLANGLTVLLFPDPSKSTITVNITYLVGSRHEGYGESGMAHLLEHLVFKGTPKHPNIPQELTSRGARPNGTTWYDRTNYFETFTASDDNLRWALDLESDRMINSYIAKKDLESEFSVVRNEFESGENDPGRVLTERILSTAYLWHNYGKSTIGSREDIERVPIENLQAFYRKYYQPDNAVLTIAGKIDEAQTLKWVNEFFGPIPRPTRVLQPTYTVEPTQDGERHVTLRRMGDVQVTAAGYHIPAGAHADFPAVNILTDILTNEPSGRIYKALVETKKASSVYGFAFALKDPGYAFFGAEVLKEKSLDEATNTLLETLDKMKENPVSAEEVDRARNKFLKSFDQTYNNSERVCLTLSEYIAKGDWRLWFLYRDNLEKVTPDDVNRVAQAYLKPANRTTGVFIPDPAPDRAVIPQAPDPAELMKNYTGRAALAEAAEFDPSPENIKSRIISGTLPGGARYSLLPKQTRGNAVQALIILRLGTEKSMDGMTTTAQLTAAMLRRGTKNYTFQQLSDALDKIKSTLSISGSGQTVTVMIQSTSEHLPEALRLTEEALRHPTFPENELEKLKDEQLASIDQNRSEPQAIALMNYDRMVNKYTKGHVRYSMNFDEQVEALKAVTIAGVRDFYTKFYNGISATVTIVGDFDDERAITNLHSILADWKAPVEFARVPNRYFEPTGNVQKIEAPDKTNAMMRAGMNLQLRDDDPDYAALTLGNFILGGGFLNSRLATRIRQKEGLSYGVGSFIQADPLDQTGSFGAFAIYNPGNSAKLIEAFKEELNLALTTGFSEEELKDAISGYLQNRKVSRGQDRELAFRLNSLLYVNRTIEWDDNLDKQIASLTTTQVNAAMKKWINSNNITFVEAGDFAGKKE